MVGREAPPGAERSGIVMVLGMQHRDDIVVNP
jgi:hypothetical protein